MPICLAVSIGFHLFILALRFDGPSAQDTSPIALDGSIGPLPAMHLVGIAEPSGRSSLISVVTVEPTITLPSVGSRSASEYSAAPVGLAGSAADAIAVRQPASSGLDPILLQPLIDARPRVLYRAGSIDDALNRRIESLNDSLALLAEAESRAASWTLPDVDGEQWSIGLDALHLGGVVVPFRHCSAGPCSGSLFSAPPGRRMEYANRLQTHTEIQQQVRRAELESSIKERIRAIRTREHAKRDSSGVGGATP